MSCSDLTILVVTQHEACTERTRLHLAYNTGMLGALYVEYDGRGAGVIENVLDDAVGTAVAAGHPDNFILRLDDDEHMSSEMIGWLWLGKYREHDHWAFPRLNLWPDGSSYIASHSLFPDYQTRLSTVEKSGGRSRVHDGSPHGTGELAPVAIEHHKFLVRDEADRRRLLAGYEALGADHGHRHFSVPEDCDTLEIRSLTVAVPA